MREETVVGPLSNQAAADRLEQWISEATRAGANVLCGGGRRGTVLDPTVVGNVSPDMRICSEEAFGPIVTVSRYGTFDEAVRALNQSDFGLQAGVFTRDVKKIFQAFRDLEVGTLLANEIPTFRADHMPYGGVKDSGIGREGLRYAIQELTEPKLLVINTSC